VKRNPLIVNPGTGSHLNPRADINLTSKPLAICIVAAMCAQIRADGDPFLQTSYDAERAPLYERVVWEGPSAPAILGTCSRARSVDVSCVGQRNRCLRRLWRIQAHQKVHPPANVAGFSVQLVNLRRTVERRPVAYTVKVESLVWALAADGVVCSVLKF
jgi:hypothetical protein